MPSLRPKRLKSILYISGKNDLKNIPFEAGHTLSNPYKGVPLTPWAEPKGSITKKLILKCVDV